MDSEESNWNIVSFSDKILTEKEKAKIDSDGILSDFKRMKLEREAQKNWDLFYKRNTTKFFKDRHWTKREFEELCHDESCKDPRVYFEIGCGVGNFMFPLIEEDSSSYFYACDFSPRAVDFVKSHPAYNENRCKAFQCDITCDEITEHVPAASVNVATLIFALSAISPEKMVAAVKNIAKVLKSRGVLLFRDYGLYDYAMLRFAKGHKLSDCFYVRQDGTRAYYFSIDKLSCIMQDAGLKVVQCGYVHRATINKKEGINVERIFIQGKFVKYSSPHTQDCNSNVSDLSDISSTDVESVSGFSSTCVQDSTK